MLELIFCFTSGLRTKWFSVNVIFCWVSVMQNGFTTSIKPQQVTFIVPGAENFDEAEISDFLQKAQNNLVGSS